MVQAAGRLYVTVNLLASTIFLVPGVLSQSVLFVANNWDNIEKWGPYVLGLWVPEEMASGELPQRFGYVCSPSARRQTTTT